MKIEAPGAFETRRFSAAPSRSEARGPADANSSDTASLIGKQIKEWQNAQDDLKALAALRSNPRQAAQEKAALLRQRLEMLKAMLQFATPGMAKALAQELKNIASQLGALGQSFSRATSGSSATSAVSEVSTTGTTDTAPAGASADTTDVSASTDAVGHTNTAPPQESASKALETDRATASGASTSPADTETLRKSLQDLQKLLHELIHRLKSLMRDDDTDAKRNLNSAEEDLAKLANPLSPDAASGFYTALGTLNTSPVGTSDAATDSLAGGTVDLSA